MGSRTAPDKVMASRAGLDIVMARTKLTPRLLSKIIALVEKGVPPYRATLATGISHTSYYEWRNLGERQRNNGHQSEGNGHNTVKNDAIFLKFLVALEKAESTFIERNVRRVDIDAEKSAESAKWLLERRAPAEFGRRQEITVEPGPVLLALRSESQRLAGVTSVLPTAGIPLLTGQALQTGQSTSDEQD